MFKAYLAYDNEEFRDTIKEEKHRWTQGKCGQNYTHKELLELGRVTYNNLEDEVKDDLNKTKQGEKEKKSEEKNFLALATQIMEKLNNPSQSNPDGGSTNQSGKAKRTFLPWRFENPDNAATKEVRGTTMKWCTNDCHPRPMWCGRKNCLNKADFASKMKAAKESKGNSEDSSDKKKENGLSNDFKIALAAMCSSEDYKTLESQFFQGN